MHKSKYGDCFALSTLDYSQITPYNDKKLKRSGVPTIPLPSMSAGHAIVVSYTQLPLSAVANEL